MFSQSGHQILKQLLLLGDCEDCRADEGDHVGHRHDEEQAPKPGRTSVFILFHQFLSLALVGTPRDLLVVSPQLGEDEEGGTLAEEEGAGRQEEKDTAANSLAKPFEITLEAKHPNLLIHFTVNHCSEDIHVALCMMCCHNKMKVRGSNEVNCR